ncbi:ATP-binding cassette domain-containing protein [Aquihabitans sp. G128]|uniref:ATP-binding cassette domain-containing protein n=1 Tax=Aquihabitans sp. G128 TaxID=2849779 RepID=UPI001C238B4A|nr:ATP-binding cassette domain-containing protein [Aquihabitans sp. G128]QXC60304.1 ATP-binding cassette domain-containing protein [Aquihabitans sp. G128]
MDELEPESMTGPGPEPGPVVEVRGVAKRYARDLHRSRRNGLASILGEVRGGAPPSSDLRESEFWALHGIDLAIEPGAAFGLLGRNGAGKSTLLRLVSGISRPTLGEIRRRGSVASLLDVSAGFDPLLTGVENVDVAFALMSGAPPSRALVEQVIEFSGIGDAARHPVRTFSQGMRMRLGFSVAVHVDPDVLIIDEAISVGDANFQLQCTEHLRSFRRAGGTLLFTTHSTLLFQLLASTGMHLVEGRVCCTGKPEDVASHYLEEIRRHSKDGINPGPGILDRERITHRARGEAAAVGHELPDDEPEEDFTPLPGRPVAFERVSVQQPDGSRARTGRTSCSASTCAAPSRRPWRSGSRSGRPTSRSASPPT